MADTYGVFVEGITNLNEFDSLKDEIKLWAAQAINKTAERGRTRAAREIRDQVNFPASYVSPSSKRLFVSKKAQRSDLEARIRARTRATSLARFVTGSTTPSKLTQDGVRVEVHPGKARFLKRAFLIRLRAGTADLDTRSNLGLAVRLKPGEVLRNKSDVRKLDRGLYLLYGPSVDQVFRARDGSGVANEIAPDLSVMMEQEFLRLVDLRR
jgi:hypothetical protein